MKTAISIPDDVHRAADVTAQRLGLNRSQLYQRAMVEFLERHGDTGVREALDVVYGEQPARVDTALAQMQKASLSREDW